MSRSAPAALLPCCAGAQASPFADLAHQGSHDVSVIDARTLAVTATVKVGQAPCGAALADGGRLRYVTHRHADSVAVVDADTLKGPNTLDGSGCPQGVAAAQMTYGYRAEDGGALPVTIPTSSIRVIPERGAAVVEGRGAIRRGGPTNDLPPELNHEAAVAAVTAACR
jgi:YVTN family beta-propeller protein